MIKLYSPQSYEDAHPIDLALICNGCGSSKAKFDFVPDTVYGLSIKEACKIHDWMYHFGVSLKEKEEADRVFLNNMLRIIEGEGGYLIWFRRRRALKYYEAVVHLGGPAFWEGK